MYPLSEVTKHYRKYDLFRKLEQLELEQLKKERIMLQSIGNSVSGEASREPKHEQIRKQLEKLNDTISTLFAIVGTLLGEKDIKPSIGFSQEFANVPPAPQMKQYICLLEFLDRTPEVIQLYSKRIEEITIKLKCLL
jgi:hypothetical protein